MENHYFQRWEIEGIANVKYDIDNVSWKKEGFIVSIFTDERLSDKSDQKIQLIWEPGSVISYHVTDETYRSDCWGLDFERNGRFYATKASKYIDEIKDKSPLVPEEVIHFTIIGTNTIVDLLAKSYPEVRKL